MRPFLITFALLLSFNQFAFSQKIKSDGYKVTLVKIEKFELKFMGEIQTGYAGTIIVKSKDSQQGTYTFYLPQLDSKFSHIAFKDVNGQLALPRIYYDEDTKTFSFHEGTDKAGSEKVKSDKTVEDLVLSGAIIWLKIPK